MDDISEGELVVKAARLEHERHRLRMLSGEESTLIAPVVAAKPRADPFDAALSVAFSDPGNKQVPTPNVKRPSILSPKRKRPKHSLTGPQPPDALDAELYECETGCGFSNGSEQVVERHEAQCRYVGTGIEGLALSNAVAVTWKNQPLDAIILELDASKGAKPIKVQFDGDLTIAWVQRKQVQHLKTATESQLKALGVQVGAALEAQDPFGPGEAAKVWHHALLDTALVAADNVQIRFWVQFKESGMSQWCWADHIRPAQLSHTQAHRHGVPSVVTPHMQLTDKPRQAQTCDKQQQSLQQADIAPVQQDLTLLEQNVPPVTLSPTDVEPLERIGDVELDSVFALPGTTNTIVDRGAVGLWHA